MPGAEAQPKGPERNSKVQLCCQGLGCASVPGAEAQLKKMKGFGENEVFAIFGHLSFPFPVASNSQNLAKKLKFINGIPDPTPSQSSIFKRYWIIVHNVYIYIHT